MIFFNFFNKLKNNCVIKIYYLLYKMIKTINTLFSVIRNSMRPDQKISLGRWNTIYNSNKINARVDLSNEDHCGPCGQYVINKRLNLKKKDN